MKYLSDYAQDGVSAVMDKYGAFFAFGRDQFEAKRVEGVVYAGTPSGMIAPKENMAALLAEMQAIYESARQQDIDENGIDAIIRRELSNYECYYTGDIDDAVDALESYGVDREQIAAVFARECAA